MATCEGPPPSTRILGRFGLMEHLIFCSLLVVILTPLQTDCRYNKYGDRYLDDEPYIIIFPKNVTYLIEESAYLSCQVQMLGNHRVSWATDKYFDTLNVTGQTYTLGNWSREDDWSLQIKWAQNNSEGMHEFQITTQPKSSFFVNLNIVTSKATILDWPKLNVDSGSTIKLTCTVLYLEQSNSIFWYHNKEIIDQNSYQERVSIITENDGEVVTSYLLIHRAEIADSGEYSCSSYNNNEVASVRVNIFNDEQPITKNMWDNIFAIPE